MRREVAGGAPVVGVVPSRRLHVHVETGQVNDADLVGLPVGLAAGVEDLALGLAFLQLDLGAGDADGLPVGAVHGEDLEADHRPRLAADQLHHVVEFHVDDVDPLAAIALGHGEDSIFQLEMAFLLGGPAADDLLHHRVAVGGLQRSPDPFQLQPHQDIEVLHRARRHVVGVRVQRRRQRGKIHLQQLVAAGLVHRLAKL